jgi:ribosome-associated heat shock protein Hsp15
MTQRDDDRAPDGKVRLDKWLWAARFFKTRSAASEAVDGGKVQVNGERAKRAKAVGIGDEVRLRLGAYEHVLVVRGLGERRGSAAEAARLYEETSASREAREKLQGEMRAMGMTYSHGAGRPGKKERREMDRFRGRG